MQTTQPISFRPDQELLKQLDTVAERLERSRAWVIKKAIQEFLVNQRQLAEIDAGLADADAGRTHTAEEVRRRLGLPAKKSKAAKGK